MTKSRRPDEFKWKEYISSRPDLEKNWNGPLRAWLHFHVFSRFDELKENKSQDTQDPKNTQDSKDSEDPENLSERMDYFLDQGNVEVKSWIVRFQKAWEFLSRRIRNTLVKDRVSDKGKAQVSILFFGITRSLSRTLPFIEENILKPLDEGGISWHLYAHTYDQKSISNQRSGEDSASLDHEKDLSLLPQDKITAKASSDVEFLKVTDVQRFIAKGDPWKGEDGNDPRSSLKNILLQLNSLKIATLLADIPNNKSGAYLFIRPDLAYLDPLPIELVRKCIAAREKELIYTPDWAHCGGLNDRFAIATPKAATMFGTRFDSAYEYSLKNQLHSETFLAEVISRFNEKGLDTRALRIRADGRIARRDIKCFSLDQKKLSDLIRRIPGAGRLTTKEKRKLNKVIITGIGRSGTTFLMRLFTELGLGTGYDPEDCERFIYKNCNAGMEKKWRKQLLGANTPYIIKSPYYCDKIPELADLYEIDMVIVPIRDPSEVARSRLKFGKDKGGLMWTDKEDGQEEILREKLDVLIADIARLRLPHIFLRFPDLVTDPQYAYDQLSFFTKDIPFSRFKQAFEKISKKTRSDYYTIEPLRTV